MVTLAPGANQEGRSGGLSVDGASAAENKYYVDGVDTTNLRTGVSATPVLTDFIQEVQVKSSGYAAEFGGATGGVVSVISKSGTNIFHGEAGAYLNTNGMNGDLALNKSPAASATRNNTAQRGPRALRLVLSGANVAETVDYPQDDYTRWDPHFQIGGPIVREKLWFWAGYTSVIEDTTRTVTFNSTRQAGTFTSSESSKNAVGNVTWQVTPAMRSRWRARPSRTPRRAACRRSTGPATRSRSSRSWAWKSRTSRAPGRSTGWRTTGCSSAPS